MKKDLEEALDALADTFHTRDGFDFFVGSPMYSWAVKRHARQDRSKAAKRCANQWAVCQGWSLPYPNVEIEDEKV